MRVQLFGCSHHATSIAVRERLAFSREETCAALREFHREFPNVEAVLLSTCNRTELYAAMESGDPPTRHQVAEFLGGSRGVDPAEVFDHISERSDREAVRHLFLVASSLDSMVVGEPQILSQVKQAYQAAIRQSTTGPLTHAAFQAALKVGRRVAHETAIHEHRVSVPSVAIADFARQIFERFDDKKALVIGGGEMAEETLRYLQKEGAADITVVNRSPDRALELADRFSGRARPWGQLLDALAAADLVISTTGAQEPIMTQSQFARVQSVRGSEPMFILDLAVPRDFEPSIGDRPGVYLYSLDDLREACLRNRRERDQELPKALRIVEEETDRFLAALDHRAIGPVVRRLRADFERPKEEELCRLFHKLPDLDEDARREIGVSFERLVNKLLHPPLETLRVESSRGAGGALLDALARLFRLDDQPSGQCPGVSTGP